MKQKLDRIAEMMQKNPPKVLPCSCTGAVTLPLHLRTAGVDFQERRHGTGRRLHNPRFGGKPRKHIGFTCTVCGVAKPL